MNPTRTGIRRFALWTRAGVVVYLTATLLAVALHQHHSSLRGHDCAICSVAHAPRVVPHAMAGPSPPRASTSAPPVAEPLFAGAETRLPASSRAPPRT